MSHSAGQTGDAAYLSQAERFVLDEIARLQSEGSRGVVMYDDLCASKALLAMPQAEWLKAVERLNAGRLINMRHAFGVPFAFVSLTELGVQIRSGRD